MAITKSTRDEILFLQLDDVRLLDEGRIEQIETEVLTAIDAATETRVVLDFTKVQFMSSSMLGKLVKINKKCQGYKVKLKLAAVTPEIAEVFKITRLDKVFDIVKDSETARKEFTKRGFFG